MALHPAGLGGVQKGHSRRWTLQSGATRRTAEGTRGRPMGARGACRKAAEDGDSGMSDTQWDVYEVFHQSTRR